GIPRDSSCTMSPISYSTLALRWAMPWSTWPDSIPRCLLAPPLAAVLSSMRSKLRSPSGSPARVSRRWCSVRPLFLAPSARPNGLKQPTTSMLAGWPDSTGNCDQLPTSNSESPRMKTNPLRTSVIGSYPFPGWLELAAEHLDRFGASDLAETQDDA